MLLFEESSWDFTFKCFHILCFSLLPLSIFFILFLTGFPELLPPLKEGLKFLYSLNMQVFYWLVLAVIKDLSAPLYLSEH